MSTKTVAITSGSSWTVPADAFGQNCTVICLGAGENGHGIIGPNTSGTGGTSGCIAQLNSFTLPNSGSVTIQIPAGNSGSACWFNSTGTVLANSISTSTAGMVGDIKVAGRVGQSGFDGGGAAIQGGDGAGAPGISTAGSGRTAGTPSYTATLGGTYGPGNGGDATPCTYSFGVPGDPYGSGGTGQGAAGCCGGYASGAGTAGLIVVIYTVSVASGAPNNDYPNPRGYVPSIALKTWQSPNAVINTLLNITYPKPDLETEWPNPPRGPFFNRDVLNFNDPIDLQLVGQDTMFGGAGQPLENYDWPVPKGPRYPSDLRTYVYSLNCWYSSQTAYYTPGMGIPMLDWPVPPGYRQPISNKTHVYNQTINQYNLTLSLRGFAGPWSQNDWPVPKGYIHPIVNRTIAINYSIYPLVYTTFYGDAGMVPPNYDWPVPKGYRQPIDLKIWSQNNTLDFTQIFEEGVFNKYDWPNPRGYIPEASLRTFVRSLDYALQYDYIINHRNPYSFSLIMG